MENGVSALAGWSVLSESVDMFVNFLWPAVSALAAVGLVSLSFIEVGKEIFKLRRLYHRGRFMAVAKKRSGEAESFLKGFFLIFPWRDLSVDGSPWKERFEEWSESTRRSCTIPYFLWSNVVRRATCGDERALLDLPPDRLVGQIDAAFQLSLSAPSRMFPIFWFVAGGADEDDLYLVLSADLRRRLPSKGELEESGAEEQDAREAEELAARNRISAQVQRQFDAWQIKFDHEWRRIMHFLSILVSAVFIAGVGTWRHSYDTEIDNVDWVFWITVAVLGGMFAPVARDFLLGLKKIRERVK